MVPGDERKGQMVCKDLTEAKRGPPHNNLGCLFLSRLPLHLFIVCMYLCMFFIHVRACVLCPSTRDGTGSPCVCVGIVNRAITAAAVATRVGVVELENLILSTTRAPKS